MFEVVLLVFFCNLCIFVTISYHIFSQILAYIVAFAAVLGGAVLAKSSLLLMTSQLEPDRKIPFCNKKYGMSSSLQFLIWTMIDRTIQFLYNTAHMYAFKIHWFCYAPGRNKIFEASIPETERISWTWAILFAFMVPEVGTFIRSLRICVFKGWRKPNTLEFVIPFLFEVSYSQRSQYIQQIYCWGHW